MGDTISYKCPSCGAALRYDVNSRNFYCDSCNNQYSLEQIKDAMSNDQGDGFDWSDYKNNLNSDVVEGTVSYICQSCGAEIITDSTTAATKCPYCDNVIVVEPNLSGIIKPNGIIPFKIDKKQLNGIFKNYLKGKIFVPKNFIDENKITEIQGVYVPFWIFDCYAEGSNTYEGTRVRTWSDINYIYTETAHYLIQCDGGMAFEKIPVDASLKTDNALMDSIEPFDYSELVPFEPGYLSGFLADRFDENVEQSKDRAQNRMSETVDDVFKSQINTFATLIKTSGNVNFSNLSVKYVLMPIYNIVAKYKDKTYNYVVNGQTGKITGNLPWSKGKFWGYLFGATGILFVIIMVVITILKLFGIIG